MPVLALVALYNLGLCLLAIQVARYLAGVVRSRWRTLLLTELVAALLVLLPLLTWTTGVVIAKAPNQVSIPSLLSAGVALLGGLLCLVLHVRGARRPHTRTRPPYEDTDD